MMRHFLQQVSVLTMALLTVSCAKTSYRSERGTSPDDISRPPQQVTFRNFRVGIQLSDQGGAQEFGNTRYSTYASSAGSNWSPWATDANAYDPDAMKLYLDMEPSSIRGTDFRVWLQASDQGGGREIGTPVHTGWASEGGGWSAPAMDANQYDADAYRIRIETRPWPSNRRPIRDFRLGLQAYDHGGREAGYTISYTKWASQGPSATDWVTDRNAYDPDGWAVHLEVR